MSIEIKDNEVFKDGEKVGYLTDPENHLRMTRGHADLREEIEMFIAASKPMTDTKAESGLLDPPVPEIKPLQSGGRGKYDPPYFWWAWNQPVSVFRGIFGITQDEFSKSEHAGYVDKVKRVLTQSH